MHVFLSWSGSKSKQLAHIFRSWLPCVIHTVKPFFSELDIAKGVLSLSTISNELEQCKVGIFLITSDNIDSPWLNFEAGAMSARKIVCTIFFDHELSSVSGPLAHWQGSNFNKHDIFEILKTINESLSAEKIEGNILEKSYDKWWPELNKKVNVVLKNPPESDPRARFKDIIVNKLSWDDYMYAIGTLNRHLSGKKISFDYIVAFSDGGLIAADLLHVLFRPEVPIISYIIERNEASIPGVSRSINVLYPTKECGLLSGKSILLLDDVINTGNSIDAVGKHLKKEFNVKEIYTAVLGIESCSPFRVHHSVFKYANRCSLPYGAIPRDLPMRQQSEQSDAS